MADEPVTYVEWGIANDVIRIWPIVAEEIDAAAEMLIAAVNKIGSVDDISGLTRSFGNAANAAGWIPNGSCELFDSKQPLADPARLHVPAAGFLGPNVRSQGPAIGMETGMHDTNSMREMRSGALRFCSATRPCASKRQAATPRNRAGKDSCHVTGVPQLAF